VLYLSTNALEPLKITVEKLGVHVGTWNLLSAKAVCFKLGNNRRKGFDEENNVCTFLAKGQLLSLP
jgi:hypothetical protein